MIRFTATIDKFDKNKEKTGWTYIEISAKQANQLKPRTKVSFRVKGSLDSYSIEKASLLPMGDGKFILPFNAAMRKATGKKLGDKLKVVLEVDDRKLAISADLLACLKEDAVAMKYFKAMPVSHQNVYSKWIDSAKTATTKTRRLVALVNGFARHLTYAEILRESTKPDF